jgi:hypothetical protein
MEAKNLKPVSWGYFWGITSDKHMYELVTADNCCCGTCRDLGFRNYEELREVIKALDAAIMKASNDKHHLKSKVGLVKQVDKEEEFRRTIYPSHLKNQDGCGSHCLTYLLASKNDSRFRKQCTHPQSDGTVGTAHESMEDFFRRGGHVERPANAPASWKPKGRAPKSSDWNDLCECCSDVLGKKEEKGNLFKCTHCNVVCHKLCIERTHHDLDAVEDWTCWECSRQLGAMNHDIWGN